MLDGWVGGWVGRPIDRSIDGVRGVRVVGWLCLLDGMKNKHERGPTRADDDVTGYWKETAVSCRPDEDANGSNPACDYGPFICVTVTTGEGEEMNRKFEDFCCACGARHEQS